MHVHTSLDQATHHILVASFHRLIEDQPSVHLLCILLKDLFELLDPLLGIGDAPYLALLKWVTTKLVVVLVVVHPEAMLGRKGLHYDCHLWHIFWCVELVRGKYCGHLDNG